MKRGYIAGLVVGIVASQAVSASEKCAAIPDSTERLACYDMEYRPATKSAKTSAWTVREEQSKMDDSKTVVVSLESEEALSKRFGGSDKASLIIRCQENETSVYFIMADHFLSSVQGYGEVTFRLDSAKPRTVGMSESTDNKALGLWGGSAVGFVKKMIGHDSMVVRVTPFNESPLTTTFPITGIDDALKPLRAACKW
jgi:type VI secretion system protein VasI